MDWAIFREDGVVIAAGRGGEPPPEAQEVNTGGCLPSELLWHRLVDGVWVATSPPPGFEEETVQEDPALALARQLLADTDWYVVRASETGKPVPETILEQRGLARELLSLN